LLSIYFSGGGNFLWQAAGSLLGFGCVTHLYALFFGEQAKIKSKKSKE